MFKLFVMSLILTLGCLSNQYTLNIDNNISLNQIQKYNYCVQEKETHNITFDFGDEVVTNQKTFYCTISDDFIGRPSIEYTGNIGLEIVSSELNNHYVKLTLPEENGKIDINFTYNGEYARGLLYSTKGENNQYAISSSSLYSAWKLVGNIPGQEYMDNDTIESEDIGPTPEDNNDLSVESQRAASGLRVYGYLKWTDDAGNIHPLIGVKVKLTHVGDFINVSTYTNSSGYFDLKYNIGITIGTVGFDIHIYAENDMVIVTSKEGDVYEKAERLTEMLTCKEYDYGTYTFSENQDSDLGNAVQIFTAVRNYSEYARTLNNGNNIEKCSVIYPTDNKDNGAYYNNQNTIHLGHDMQRVSGFPSVPGSWDVIGHEYAHHLQKYFFMREYYGTHYIGKNDIQAYFYLKNKENSNYTIDNNEIKNAKVQGLGLSWKEAWPTFFTISAQSTFSNDLKKVPTVGDYQYVAYNGVTQNLTSLNNEYGFSGIVNGETDETIIMSFLYRLWDSANTISCDKLSISDADLWTIMVANNPEHFYGFIDALYNSGLEYSRSDLGLLLEGFKISASDLSVNVFMNYAECPTFNWAKNGANIYFNGTTYNYANNKFSLYFYNANKELILKKDNIKENYYTLRQNEWDSILLANGTKYYVVIQSFATLGVESGPYYSQYYEFDKPSSASTTIELNNNRYYEKTLVIS